MMENSDLAEYGPPARFRDYPRGSFIQFLDDECDDILTGEVIYAYVPFLLLGYTQMFLIVITLCGDEWWVPPANVVVPLI